MTTLPPARYGTPLTGRELQILVRIAQGRTYAQIAADLGLSTASVCTHVRRLLAKLGARDRAHAVGIGMRTGLIGSHAVIRPGRRWLA
ncbi:response regulator transcription factor [Streptomyces violascens]|uniref:response regulator transcription factor n=1 Tax=Streptomyces violascens TaxID=67381 RepID=UPI0036B53D63